MPVRKTMKALFPALVAVLALSGCLAHPHLDQRSPEVRGQIVDATTWEPLKNAKVEFAENPALAALTDDKGEFVIRATKKPELFFPMIPLLGEMNIGQRIDPVLRVTRDGYRPADVDATQYEYLDLSRFEPDANKPVSAQGPLFLKPLKLDRLAQAD
jgi:hypothetical protein